MITSHNLLQGSQPWHAFRAEHFGASEASAMLGLSPYKTRTQLLNEKKTGLTADVDAFTQKIFDKGHAVEALARPIVEKMIGEELSPMTFSNGKLSASCDGINFEGNIAWENKQFNAAHYEQVKNLELPEIHWPQCQQVLHCTGAEKLFFTISDGTEERTAGIWVFPDVELQAKVIDGWAQFEKDLANHTTVIPSEKLEAKTIEGLPTLFIQAVGEITTNNMKEYGQALAKRLNDVRQIVLVSDQDFVDAKAAAKHLRDSIDQAKQAKEAMLSQTVTVGEAARMIDAWCEDMRKTALKLENDVEAQDKIKKTKMITEAKEKFTGIIAALETETAPIRILETTPDFANAIKGKRNYDSMQGAINDLLANAELHVNNLAKDLRAKLTWFKSLDCQFPIFADLQTLIYKQADDFKLAVNARIAEHEKALADAAARQAEFKAKLEIAAKEELKIKPGAADLSKSPINNLINEADCSKHVAGVDLAAGEDKTVVTNIGKRPTAEAIINLVATTYSVDKPTAQRWLTQSFAQAKAA